jgi:hypothetical protein
MQAERQPAYPLMYSMAGFQYCDLLLTEAERAARQLVVAANWRSPQTSRAIPSAQAKKDGGEHQFAATPLLESCRAVSERAAQSLKIVLAGSRTLLDIALNHLTLGRAALYAAILSARIRRREEAHSDTPPPNAGCGNESQSLLTSAATEIDPAISGLRRASTTHCIPAALLTRAWQRRLTSARTGPESAQSDLNEAWEIAERDPMPLFLADIHLHRARLCGRAISDQYLVASGKNVPPASAVSPFVQRWAAVLGLERVGAGRDGTTVELAHNSLLMKEKARTRQR